MMKILVDNNVVLNALLQREPQAEECTRLLEFMCFKLCKAYVATKSVTDMHYIMLNSIRKSSGITRAEAEPEVRSLLGSYLCLANLADTTKENIEEAFHSSMKDFEDGVIASVAVSCNADYIVTYNLSDYINSPVKALKPAEFIELLQSDLSASTAQKTSTVSTSYF